MSYFFNISSAETIMSKMFLINTISLKLYANKYDVEFNKNNFFPVNTLYLMRGALLAQKKGKIVETGDPLKVLKNPKKKFTQKLIDCSIQLPKEWT